MSYTRYKNALNVTLTQALRSRMGAGGSSASAKVFCQCALFLEEPFKYILFERSNQKCTRKPILYTSKLENLNVLLLVGFYQIENIKTETLLNRTKYALGRIDH